jgi:hypothetical protein
MLRIVTQTHINERLHLMTDNTLTLSRGQMVLKGKFLTGDFAKRFNARRGSQSHFDGSWNELEALVEKHQHDFQPGTGSVNNDVILVNVPAQGFFSSVVTIDDTNRHLVRNKEVIRAEGEKPVVMKQIIAEKVPASYVQIVVYRADVLAADNSRTTDAEWEIVAILANVDKVTPMHPTTMLRNANHDEGGTFREYTDQEWADAYAYWENHAYAITKES